MICHGPGHPPPPSNSPKLSIGFWAGGGAVFGSGTGMIAPCMPCPVREGGKGWMWRGHVCVVGVAWEPAAGEERCVEGCVHWEAAWKPAGGNEGEGDVQQSLPGWWLPLQCSTWG